MMTEAHHFTLVAGGAVRMMLDGDAEGVARWQSAITHHRNPLPVFCICFSHPLLVDIIFIPRILHLENLPPLCCMNQTVFCICDLFDLCFFHQQHMAARVAADGKIRP
jgi:hypothetical protein